MTAALAANIPGGATEDSSEASSPLRLSPLLSARGLTKRYGARIALSDLELTVRPGETVMLLGPNGAGKTTFMHLCAGLLRADGGEVRLLGGDPRIAAVRTAVGLVPQHLGLYPRLTVGENLRFFARVLGVPRTEREARVREGLALSGLGEREHERAAQLSGGMLRRLNFACAVLHRPRLLLLDEPTVGVDPEARAHLHEAIRAQREAGVTIMCSTHLFDEAERLGERMLIMHRGRVLADGSPAELLARHGTHDLQQLVLQLTGSARNGALP